VTANQTSRRSVPNTHTRHCIDVFSSFSLFFLFSFFFCRDTLLDLETASASCEEFLAAVENKMDQKRQEHLIVAPQQLVNPENVRLTQQRDQLEQLLQRLGSEVKAWQSHSNEEWNRPMNEMSTTTEEEDAQEAAAYHQNAENDTSQPFERMNSKIMKMAVQVEQIQHALEQSKRTVTIAETKRMQLSAQVHSAGKYSKKPASSLIRGFLG